MINIRLDRKTNLVPVNNNSTSKVEDKSKVSDEDSENARFEDNLQRVNKNMESNISMKLTNENLKTLS